MSTAFDVVFQKAGPHFRLQDAADHLGITVGDLLWKIKSHKVLYVIYNHNIHIPEFQFHFPEMAGITELFNITGAGNWSALQFMVEHDPNLNMVPLEALRSGKSIIHAAKSYLE